MGKTQSDIWAIGLLASQVASRNQKAGYEDK
jgi:hypothetical protein